MRQHIIDRLAELELAERETETRLIAIRTVIAEFRAMLDREPAEQEQEATNGVERGTNA